MKNDTPAVHCVFNNEGKALRELLEESFRQYLRRVLAEEEPVCRQ